MTQSACPIICIITLLASIIIELSKLRADTRKKLIFFDNCQYCWSRMHVWQGYANEWKFPEAYLFQRTDHNNYRKYVTIVYLAVPSLLMVQIPPRLV